MQIYIIMLIYLSIYYIYKTIKILDKLVKLWDNLAGLGLKKEQTRQKKCL